MNDTRGMITVICGRGAGKTNAAIGKGIKALADGKSVTLIQFLKGKANAGVMEVLKRLEPEMKAFSFERFRGHYLDLSEEDKKEERINIRNGLNFAHKVLVTDGCDVLILDELLGLADLGIVSEDELLDLIRHKPEHMEIVITGLVLPESFRPIVDSVSLIEPLQ